RRSHGPARLCGRRSCCTNCNMSVAAGQESHAQSRRRVREPTDPKRRSSRRGRAHSMGFIPRWGFKLINHTTATLRECHPRWHRS
ncbi:hypothetical protein LTR40_013332, partial [Exophiala xenobiotica]